MVTTESLRRIPDPLLRWYRENRRDLEWRTDPLPYYVWVSEIMLQQTRVEAVRPYFRRFIDALPDVRALARCPEEQLLKLWEGLGYYSRARNLHRAAEIVVSQYAGVLPQDPDELKRLPGIGSYTAGAIASIAYGLPAPAADGNVLRILSRITGSEQCIDEPKVKTAYEDAVRALLESRPDMDPGAFNQALMDIGAMVCLPNRPPRCGACPLRDLCRAAADASWDRIPVRKAKKGRRIEERTVLVVRDAFCVLLHRRPDRGLLAGLWELPGIEGHADADEAAACCRRIGVQPLRITALPESKHIFTHVEWHMTGYQILAEDLEDLPAGYEAVPPDRIQEDYSVPAAFAAYTNFLDIRLGQKRYDSI